MVTLEKKAPEKPFLDALEKTFVLKKEDSLSKWRQMGWEQLLQIGLPSRKREDYGYVRLRKLWSREWQLAEQDSKVTAEDVAPHVLPECARSYAVFVNGAFRPELSDVTALPDLTLLPLDVAMKKYRGFLQGSLKKEAKEERDPFALVNYALHEQGAFAYLPPNKELSQPLQLLYLSNAKENDQLFSRIHFLSGVNSSMNVIRTTSSSSDVSAVVCGVIDVSLEEGAQFKMSEREELSKNFCFDAIRATLKKASLFKSFVVSEGAAISRRDYRVALVGEGAECELSGLSLLDKDREGHTHVLVDHQAPNCRSMQVFKGVLGGFSRSSFEGKIYVHQAAQKSDAYQLNNNLLLSDGAHADSKPNLEIFADDVKASHGSTMGQLDASQLHYLRTRGCTKKEAERMLVHAFAREVSDRIPFPEERERAEKMVKKGL